MLCPGLIFFFFPRAGLVYSDMRPTKSEAVHDANGNPLDLRLVEAMPITLAGEIQSCLSHPLIRIFALS